MGKNCCNSLAQYSAAHNKNPCQESLNDIEYIPTSFAKSVSTLSKARAFFRL